MDIILDSLKRKQTLGTVELRQPALMIYYATTSYYFPHCAE